MTQVIEQIKVKEIEQGKEKRNVPELRFKEFEDEWEEKKLGNFLIRSNDITTEHTDIPVLTSSRKGLFFQSEYFNRKISADDTTGYNILKKGYFTYRYMSDDSIFHFNINKLIDIGLVSPEYPVFTTNKNLDSYFLENHLNNSLQFFKFCKMQKKGGTRTCLYFNVLETYKIKIPSIQEQKKIADFFSLVDKKIEKQSEKVEALKTYQKGIMQKIFKQEIRFKAENGEEYPEWEEKRLGDVLNEVNEKTTVNNQYEILSSTANGILKQSEYFNREIASNNNIGYKVLRYNQIVLSPQNLWLGNINYNDKFTSGLVSPSYKVFNIDCKYNSKYISYIIKTNRMLNEYKNASEQGASVVRRNLNTDLFYDIKVIIPILEEQTKIAEFLTTIDEKMDKEEKKLEELKVWKKGLLQKMFV